jgi:hypothetical protein
LISVALEPPQQLDTGSQASVATPPIPAAELAALLCSFRGARLVEPITRSIPSLEPTVRVDVASMRSFRGATLLDPIVRVISQPKPILWLMQAPWVEFPRPPADAVSFPNVKFERCLTDAIEYPCFKGWPETFRKTSWEERCAGLEKHTWGVKWFEDWSSYTPGKFPANGAAYFQRYTAHGKFGGAATSAAVRYGRLHKVYIARILNREDEPLHLASCISYSAPKYEGTDAPTSVIHSSQEVIDASAAALDREVKAGAERVRSLRAAYEAAVKEKEVNWSLLPAAEIRGLKSRKSGDQIEPEDEEGPDTEEQDEGIYDSETNDGTCYNNDPRFDDDEENSGRPEGHDHIIPLYEDGTCETEEPLTHEQLQVIRQTANDKIAAGEDPQKVKYTLEIFTRNRTAKEAAENQNIKPATAQKQQERFFVEAMAMLDGKKGIPYVELSYKQAEDIADNGAVYALVKPPKSTWTWYRLDVAEHGTIEAALEALKIDKMFNALEDNKDYMKGVPGTMGPIKARYDWAFNMDRVRIAKRPEPSWKGLLASKA